MTMMKGRLAVGNQIIHDQASVTLVAPARIVLAGPVLQIKNRIPLGKVSFVVRRRVDETARDSPWRFGSRNSLAAVGRAARLAWHRSPDPSRALPSRYPSGLRRKDHAARVRKRGAVDRELVVVEAFVLRLRDAGPDAVFVLGERIFLPAQIEGDALGLRR